MSKRVKHILMSHSTADVIAVLSLVAYSLLALFFAHTTRPILDEGLYTYKGWLFVSGHYQPYQDYGPWMNHMPLSFLIPGVIQELFGPGLRTGRYFAIALGIMMLIGLYFTARRLGGRWVAAATILASALNLATVGIYSVAISQGLVACVLAWILFLSLGEDRPLWQILLAAFLAAAMVLIRINMFPVFILLMFYIWWDFGWSKARWVIMVAVISLVFLHALFGPKIVHNWAVWLPFDLTALFELPDLDDSFQEASAAFRFPYTHLDSLFITVRSHFVAITGAIATWLLWPHRDRWEKETYYRIAVFLSVSFGLMFFLHAWASLGLDYCVLCLPIYTAFFQILGILLVVASWRFWRKNVPFANQLLTVVFIFIACAGIAYNLKGTLDIRPNETVQSILVSALSTQNLSSGVKNQILYFIMDAFSIQNIKDAVSLSKRISLISYGIFAGAMFFLLAGIIGRFQKRFVKTPASFSNIVLCLFLLVGYVLLPSKILSNDNVFQCREDQILNFEKLGEELAQKIPGGAQIYWLGYSPSLLLYLPEVKIYPPQLNGYNNFSNSPDSDELYRNGAWNDELADRWAQDSSHMILIQAIYESPDKVVKKYVKSGIYREAHLNTTSSYTCDETNQLTIRLFEK